MPQNRKKKEKRLIPTREIGKPIDHQQLRPSQILFQQAKAEIEIEESLDTQSVVILDTQNNQLNTPQQTIFGHSKTSNLDTLIREISHPNKNVLDTQDRITGHPKETILDTYTPKKEIETPKKVTYLDTKTTKIKTLDTQKKYDYKKYEANRSTVRVNLHLHKDLDQRVREYCVKAKPRLELKEFFELAALHFLDTQKENPLSANAPLDDRRSIIFKTSPSIINLYRELSGNLKWKINDDAKASAYNQIDLRFIELGILHTIGNKQGGGKINSFAYFIPEIENWSNSGLDSNTIEGLIRHYRNRLGFKTEDT